MAICVVGSILHKPESDRQLFKMSWADLLNTGLSSSIALYDQIASSTWAYDADTPATSGAIEDSGFDASSGQTWMTFSGGSESDVVHLNNTIITTGALFNGKTTPPQLYVRQIRIRIGKCA